MTYIKFVFQLIYDNIKTIKETYHPYFYEKFVTNVTKKAGDIYKDTRDTRYYLHENNYALEVGTLGFMNNYEEFKDYVRKNPDKFNLGYWNAYIANVFYEWARKENLPRPNIILYEFVITQCGVQVLSIVFSLAFFCNIIVRP